MRGRAFGHAAGREGVLWDTDAPGLELRLRPHGRTRRSRSSPQPTRAPHWRRSRLRGPSLRRSSPTARTLGARSASSHLAPEATQLLVPLSGECTRVQAQFSSMYVVSSSQRESIGRQHRRKMNQHV